MGPASAGASPGPACYRQGGTEATVTDANLILGRLDSETPLADDLFLDREAASTAIAEHVGQKLGMGVEEAALAINRIADVKMAYAIRGLTLEKGLDPREFVLVAFGGAGPLHAASIASLLGIPRVLVPRAPGNFSAWGMLSTDLRHDLVRTIDLPGDPSCLPTLRQAFQEMEEQGQEIMARHGANQSPRQLRWGVDARYKGQEHSLTVPFEAEKIDTTALAKLLADFHSLHESQYGHSSPEDSAEFVATRLELNARLEKPPFYKLPTDAKMLELTAVSFRDVTFESGIRRTPVFERSALFPGCRIEGPAIINEPSSTVLVPPSAILQVDGDGNLIIDLPSTEG
ncbi:MAG: hydantoinase/oxoprolinase family protein [Ardenticatenaceae bacterium]|nr:hydantoinase/oxoprolinase family protein [Ardenticatenaceae bacterium]